MIIAVMHAILIINAYMPKNSSTFAELPVGRLLPNAGDSRPHSSDESPNDKRLRSRSRELGILSPINVVELVSDYYMALDGRRRLARAVQARF
jgi:hypothetical protein